MAKILIIEDDWQLQQLVSDFLSRHGHEVKTASDGGQGLLQVADFLPDLILCDLDMPGVDGKGVVSSLRQDDKLGEIPVIFLSACSDRKEIRRSMNSGGDDFISKPAELPEILETVNARIARLGQQRHRKAQQLDQAADFIAGIINNLDPAKSDIKWWSEAGESRSDSPNPIIQRVRQILKTQPPAKHGEASSPGALSTLMIKDENRRQYLQLSEVKVFLADGEYSVLYWGDHRHIMFRKPLKHWELELPPERFVRVHRSAIINLAFLDFVEQDLENKQHIHIKGFKQVIAVSQRAKAAFNRSLKKFRPMKG